MVGRNLRRWAGRRPVLLIVAALAAAPGLVAGTAMAAPAQPGTQAQAAAAPVPIPIGTTTTYAQPSQPDGPTCMNYTYTVPSDVTRVQAVVNGAAGRGGDNAGFFDGGGGGHGQQVQATLAVTPGESLDVNVADNGFRGLGSGPTGGNGTGTYGGAGGDPSYISTDNVPQGSCTRQSFLVLAAGGGGGGAAGGIGDGGGGGDGGFANGSKGGDGDHNGPAAGAGGSGATQAAGGAGGNPATTAGGTLGGGPGSFLQGGCGGQCNANDDDPNGAGGGGGGYYGGGAGGDGQGRGGGGGGGGSSYVGSNVTDVSHGQASGSASVAITPIAGPPAAPPMYGANEGANQVTLTFGTTTADGGSPIDFYTVKASPGGNVAQVSPASADSDGTFTVPITNLVAGKSFTFTVTATNTDGFVSAPSAASNAAVPYQIPDAPLITSVTPGSGQATVAFTESKTDQRLGNPINFYSITATPQGGGSPVSVVSPSPVTVRGLTNGTSYLITVSATNRAGTGPRSKPATVTPRTVPGAPTALVATLDTPASTTGTANIAFSPPASNGGAPITGYTVTSSPGGLSATAGPGATSVDVGGLTFGTSYTFTMVATNAAGASAKSAPSNAVTPVMIPSPPLTPGAATLDQAAYVSCGAPLDNGGSAITSYTVTSSPDNITATRASCPILVAGLTDGTKYTFTVTATNADGGTSQPSQPTAVVKPHAPSGKAPANDNFASAQVISGASGSVVGTNVGATVEPGETTIQDVRGGASVWYKWTAPADGSYQFDTCSANPGVAGLIGLFLGNSASAPEFGAGPSQDLCPAGQAGATIIVGPISAGITLDIKFDGLNENGSGANPPYEGPFTLEWSPAQS
ncbi:MAG TPA: fibronectin type III domain-containing protein [Streptosporangiaceae bacterium]